MGVSLSNRVDEHTIIARARGVLRFKVRSKDPELTEARPSDDLGEGKGMANGAW